MPHKHYSGFLLVSLMRTQPIGARGLRGNSQSATTGSSHTPSCTAHIAADDGYVTADLDRSPSVEMWDLSADAVLHPSLYERFMCREIKRRCLQWGNRASKKKKKEEIRFLPRLSFGTNAQPSSHCTFFLFLLSTSECRTVSAGLVSVTWPRPLCVTAAATSLD